MSKYIKKADYIAMYGEEAWDAYAEKRREYNKQYAKEHKEYFAEYNKQYYQDNIEERKEYSKQHYQGNKERVAERQKQYYETQWGRANKIKGHCLCYDKKRGFPTDQNIDEDWIIENIFNSSCIYCGDSDWTHLGADRIDNTKPHTPDNCVCSCGKCNVERNNRYSVEEFVKISKNTKDHSSLSTKIPIIWKYLIKT